MPLTLQYAKEENAIDRFVELACLTYHRDREVRRVEARRMLAENPQFSDHDIFSICCTGNFKLLQQVLESNDVDVNQAGGPMSWPPLLYSCYSRVEMQNGSTLETAKLLIAHGADPNAFYMWGDQYKFTALTGVYGEGEAGPLQDPPHRDCNTFAKMLLDAGADPNDSQALYNRMFTPGSECLKMLLDAGLTTSAKNNWLNKEAGVFKPNESLTLVYQLSWAIEKHHHDRVKMILDSVDESSVESFVNQELDTSANKGSSFLKIAMLDGNQVAEEMLISKGATRPQLTLNERFASAVASSDLETAQTLLSENGSDADGMRSQLPDLLISASGSGRQSVVQCALDLGVDVNVLKGATALHQAAWSGQLEMVKMLLTAGADASIRDQNHDATAEDWGNYSGNTKVAGFLNSRTG